MNFYSSDAFCDALAASHFPNQTVKPKLYRVGMNAWRIPTVNGGKPVAQFPIASSLVDFYEPYRFTKAHSRPSQFKQNSSKTQDHSSLLSLPSSQENPYVTERFLRTSSSENLAQQSSLIDISSSRETNIQASINESSLKYLPRVSHGLITAEAWMSNPVFEARYKPAPAIFWKAFSSWNTYREARPTVFLDIGQRLHKLEQELGVLSFRFDNPSPQILLDCIALKSQQSQSASEGDLFSRRESIKLFQEMAQRKLITVSSLQAGETLLATSICATDNQCLYYWISAFNHAYQQHNPGILLLNFLLKESFERGYEEFDFLMGKESEQWQFATHTRLISDVGRQNKLQRPLKHFKQIAPRVVVDAINRAQGLSATSN